MRRGRFETPNDILASAWECGYGKADNFGNSPDAMGSQSWTDFLEAFTVRGVANRSSFWLWEKFREPSLSVSGPVNLEVLLAFAPADTRIWLLVEDGSPRKRKAPFWAFDATLAAAIGTLCNHHSVEFSYRWALIRLGYCRESPRCPDRRWIAGRHLRANAPAVGVPLPNRALQRTALARRR